jgi:hypothetical protein
MALNKKNWPSLQKNSIDRLQTATPAIWQPDHKERHLSKSEIEKRVHFDKEKGNGKTMNPFYMQAPN